MNKKYRRAIIAGNWKMNMTPTDVRDYAAELKPLIPKEKLCDIVLCAPAVTIPAAVRAFRATRVAIGGQNMHYEASGAYTGEISADMLVAAGAKYTIIGHSERRAYYGETDADVNKKLHAALAAGLRPIVCVGETLDQRETGATYSLINYQLSMALYGLDATTVRRVTIAYEPIWAIGTGRAATAEDAEEVCRDIRIFLRSNFGARSARAVSILYGGSMKPANAAELLACPDIDGGLIGGASLKADEFGQIIAAAQETARMQREEDEAE